MRQAAVWFPKRLSLAIGLMITLGMFGGMMQVPFSVLIAQFNWEYGLYIDFIFSVLILGVLFLWLSEKVESNHNTERQLFSLKNVWKHFTVAMSNKQNWLCAIFAGLLNLPVMVLGALWGGYYLIHVHQLNNEQASFINSMIFFGMIIASPLLGWISDKMHSRKIPMLIGSFLSIMMAAGLFYFNHNFLELSILFFMIGFACTTQILSFSVVTETSNARGVSMAMSFISIIFYLIGAIGNPVFGYLMSLSHSSSLLPNLFFALSFILSFFIALFIKESFNQKKYK
jgi:MFS family permease